MAYYQYILPSLATLAGVRAGSQVLKQQKQQEDEFEKDQERILTKRDYPNLNKSPFGEGSSFLPREKMKEQDEIRKIAAEFAREDAEERDAVLSLKLDPDEMLFRDGTGALPQPSPYVGPNDLRGDPVMIATAIGPGPHSSMAYPAPPSLPPPPTMSLQTANEVLRNRNVTADEVDELSRPMPRAAPRQRLRRGRQPFTLFGGSGGGSKRKKSKKSKRSKKYKKSLKKKKTKKANYLKKMKRKTRTKK